MLDYPGRGRIRITSRGADLIRQAPATINLKLLMQYPEFVAFRQSGAAPDGRVEVTGSSGEEPQVHSTPEEKLEASYKESRNRLAEELQELMLKCSPAFFERLVIDVLVEMGYGGSREDAAEVLGKTGDNGVDGIIKEDKLGLDAIYVQAKRWQGTVGRPELQAFAGSLEGHRARKGVFITTSAFSREARDYVRNIEKKIVLLDGPELAKHMIDHGVGVSDVATYKIRRVDLDYFDESK